MTGVYDIALNDLTGYVAFIEDGLGSEYFYDAYGNHLCSYSIVETVYGYTCLADVEEKTLTLSVEVSSGVETHVYSYSTGVPVEVIGDGGSLVPEGLSGLSLAGLPGYYLYRNGRYAIVYNEDMEAVSQYAWPTEFGASSSYYAAGGNVISQRLIALPADSPDYDLYDRGVKYSLFSYRFSLKNGEFGEIDLDYRIERAGEIYNDAAGKPNFALVEIRDINRKSLDESNAVIDSLKLSENTLRKEIESLQNALNESQSSSGSMKLFDDTLRQENENLKKDNQSLRSSYEESKLENESLRNEMESLKSELESLKDENESLRNSLETLNSTIESLKNENESLRNSLETLNSTIESFQSSEDTLKNENASLQRSLEEMKRDNDSLKKSLDESNSSLDSLKSSEAALKKELESAQNSLNSSSQKCLELENALKAARQCEPSDPDSFSDLLGRTSLSISVNSSLSDRSSQIIASLQKENQELNKRVVDLIVARETALKSVQLLESKITFLQNDLSYRQSENTTLASYLEEKNKLVGQLRGQLAAHGILWTVCEQTRLFNGDNALTIHIEPLFQDLSICVVLYSFSISLVVSHLTYILRQSV